MHRLRVLSLILSAYVATAGSLAFPPALMAASGVLNVAGIEGLPVMPGLREKPDERVVFDTPGGRIIEAFAVGQVKTTEVSSFYQATLAQLGWRRIGELIFEREGEMLTIDFPGKAGSAGSKPSLTVRFTVRPHGPPENPRVKPKANP